MQLLQLQVLEPEEICPKPKMILWILKDGAKISHTDITDMLEDKHDNQEGLKKLQKLLDTITNQGKTFEYEIKE